MRYITESTQGTFTAKESPTTPTTMTGKALTTRKAIERLRAGTLEEKISGYYHDAHVFPDEADIPDFNRMTRLQRLALLRKKQDQVKDLEKDLQEQITKQNIIKDEKSKDTINERRTEENGSNDTRQSNQDPPNGGKS